VKWIGCSRGLPNGVSSGLKPHLDGTSNLIISFAQPHFFLHMAPTTTQSSQLANPLASTAQLSSSGSQLDGVPADLEDSIRFAGASLTQAAGILLRLPQEIIAQAVIIFTRFWVGPEGGSLTEYSTEVPSLPSNSFISNYSNIPRSSPPAASTSLPNSPLTPNPDGKSSRPTPTYPPSPLPSSRPHNSLPTCPKT
jgi:hypothetical protein